MNKLLLVFLLIICITSSISCKKISKTSYTESHNKNDSEIVSTTLDIHRTETDAPITYTDTYASNGLSKNNLTINLADITFYESGDPDHPYYVSLGFYGEYKGHELLSYPKEISEDTLCAFSVDIVGVESEKYWTSDSTLIGGKDIFEKMGLIAYSDSLIFATSKQLQELFGGEKNEIPVEHYFLSFAPAPRCMIKDDYTP